MDIYTYNNIFICRYIMPKFISVLNDKGGVGKTTISTNLAHGLVLRGYKTLLADSDPRRSARDWHALNGATIVDCIGVDTDTLAADVTAIGRMYDVVVIDGPANISKLSAAAIRVSDAILIPVQPSPYDVFATADIVELIRTRQSVAEGKPQACFILSRVIKNTLLSREVHDPLKEYGFPVLHGKTSQSVLYPTSASKGESIFSHGENAVAHEFNTLIEEIVTKYINR